MLAFPLSSAGYEVLVRGALAQGKAALMDALTQTIRDAWIADGASPATALFLATEQVATGRKAIRKERAENIAQAMLPLGRHRAAQEIGCSPNHVYKIIRRVRQSLSKVPYMDDATA